MNLNRPRPIGITVDKKERVVRIAWGDSHQSDYPFELLRYNCPCAECQGEGNMPGTLALRPVLNTDIRDTQLVGNYALQFTWGDGHSYGIYPWDRLRLLCPCENCQAARAGLKEP